MRKLALALLSLLALAGFVWLLARERPEGPVPIVWDKTPCAHCRMHIGDPAFAAQLQMADGRVLDFDDPGCLLEVAAIEAPAIRAAYFHHVEQDRWLALHEVGFVPHPRTPMGYGLAAVERDRPGAMSFERALDHVRAKAHTAGRSP